MRECRLQMAFPHFCAVLFYSAFSHPEPVFPFLFFCRGKAEGVDDDIRDFVGGEGGVVDLQMIFEPDFSG